MQRSRALAALFILIVVLPSIAAAQVEHPIKLVDFQSAYGLPKGGYSLGMRIVPDGGVITGLRVGISDYVLAGVSYGASNVVGSGSPEWEDRIEFDIKLRIAEETDVIPEIAIGYDSRGYGRQLESGEYEKASPGIYVSAAKTLPFSEFWQAHAGLSRTLDEERAKPDIVFGASARLSQEFSVVAEYQWEMDRLEGDPEGTTGCLNFGLRWIFMEQLEVDIYFRNIVGPSGSPELNSRALGFAFYDSF
jgi:hypothetical protein